MGGRILLIGATGYIGSAVAAALRRAGHELVAVSRHLSADSPYDTVPGDLTLPGMLAAAVRTVRPSAVVHAGVPTGEVHTDVEGVRALGETGAPVLYTSGIWFLGAVAGSPFTEEPSDGPAPRARIERAVLARPGSVVLRPGVVYGHDGGIPAEMVGWARTHGRGRHVGPAGTRWPTVHVDDLADLFVRVVVRLGTAGAVPPVLHGVGEDGVPVGEIAAAADVAAGGEGRADEWTVDDAGPEIGAGYAANLALDQVISSERTRAALGWRPGRPGIVGYLRGNGPNDQPL